MDELWINYRFTFDQGKTEEFRVVLDRATLTNLGKPRLSPAPWTELEVGRCTGCPLDPRQHRHCPIAVNLDEVVQAFRDCFSYETVEVCVATADRTYAKQVSIQDGLSALLGIIMVTSGCPRMERLKPMVRFHLPFAAVEETAYRMLSTYLLAQLYRHRQGLAPDWDLLGMEKVYEEVGLVNDGFSDRLTEAARRDANVNALVKLDCFAKLVPMTMEDLLEEMAGYFGAYLQGGEGRAAG